MTKRHLQYYKAFDEDVIYHQPLRGYTERTNIVNFYDVTLWSGESDGEQRRRRLLERQVRQQKRLFSRDPEFSKVYDVFVPMRASLE